MYRREGKNRDYSYLPKYDRKKQDRRWENEKDYPRKKQEHRFRQEYRPRVFGPTSCLELMGVMPEMTEAMFYEFFDRFQPLSVKFLVDRDVGNRKDIAHVEFGTSEKAQDVLEYYGKNITVEGASIDVGYTKSTLRFDWICEFCQISNYARREVCFKCQAPKTERSVLVPANIQNQQNEEPREVLAIRSIPYAADENELRVAFQRFSSEIAVRLVRDRVTNESRGFGFVEFPTIAIATEVLNAKAEIYVHGYPVNLSYAKDSFRGPPATNAPANPIAMAAMEQAQWSLSNRANAMEDTSLSNAKADSVKTPKTLETKIRKDWPTPFGAGGLSYAFDQATGFYYEDDSGFYYDVSSQLYYSAIHQKYYSHDASKAPPFVEFEPPVPGVVDAAPVTTKPSGKKMKKKGISIGFKKNGVKIAASMTKKQMQDTSKWTALSKAPDAEAVVQPRVSPVAMTKTVPSMSNVVAPIMPAKPKTTPVSKGTTSYNCLICRRKFNSQEILKKHEAQSKLHKENVAKAELAKQPKYRDRAKERRELHGVEEESPITAAQMESEEPVIEASSVHKPITTSSIGNKLLQKMGWKEGKGLGKHEEGIKDPVLARGRGEGETAGLGAAPMIAADTTIKNPREVLALKLRSRYDAIP